MTEQQKPADMADRPKTQYAHADNLAQLSIERRTLLFGPRPLRRAHSRAKPPPRLTRQTSLERWPSFRASIPSHFDREYVENAVVPFSSGSIFAGERPILPMIDLPLTKQDAIPWDFWGLLYETGSPPLQPA